ncbi:BTAD domain-containing putative transcriptional regulator [Streptomyces sp. TLI_171]|uniref:AfsR/SARP family transcriptional regulator n=1 Tax=Streptomyces sp. TLI_171 TaxID=1938859 RepID=UPI000C1A46DA|nr:DNA-binding SARP family transcriptional activator [Streptomyces sp. TLI_171]
MGAAVDPGPGGGTRFTVLGLLAIADRRETAVLQPSKPASLLAALLTRPNAVVPVESLQRAIWGEEVPATAKAALHSCVLRLRRLFAKYGISGSTIEALPGGYRMAVDARTLDLLEFRELLGRADRAADPAAELALLRSALALWQPALLGNVHSDVLHREEVPRLAEEWLRTVERVYDIELALGRCREVLSELWPLARSHPAHERFWEQLIEALHRTGRRADALAEYRRVRAYLREELGVEPGPALQHLELAVLRGESPAPLGPPAPPAVATGAAMTGSATGEVVLAGLVQAGLLRQGPGGRYQVHELLSAFTRAAGGSWANPSKQPLPARAVPAAGADQIPSVRQSAAPLRTTEV